MLNDLKIPMAGYRTWNDASLYNQDGTSKGFYWSASIIALRGDRMYFTPGAITPSDDSNRSYGFSVRCFKN
jgi:hypothetical protein